MRTGAGGDPLGACATPYSDHLYTIPLLSSPTVPSHFLFSLFWFCFNFLSKAKNGDLLSNEYGFRCPRVAVSGPPELRQNDTEHPSNNLWAAPALFLVIIVSPCRNIPKFSKSSRNISRMFSCSKFQFYEGEFQ